MIKDDQAAGVSYKPRTVQSVEHAVALMRTIGSRLVTPTLSELSRTVGLSKPATYNLLNTLISEGLVSKDATARYTLDWAVYELGSAVAAVNSLKTAARFSIDRLAQVAGGAALLSVISEDSVLYLDRGQHDPGFTMIAGAGRRSPLHTNASGKVLLAYQPDHVVRKYLGSPLKAKTTTTITDPGRLWAELARVREEGFGACWGEQEPALSSVAVPILDENQMARATLAIALPTQRFTKVSRSRLVATMQDEARDIAASLLP